MIYYSGWGAAFVFALCSESIFRPLRVRVHHAMAETIARDYATVSHALFVSTRGSWDER